MQVTTTHHVGNPYRVEDPRSVVEKMRRRELRAFCTGHGIPFSTESAVSLRNLIRERGLLGTEPYETVPKPMPAPFQEKPQLGDLREKMMKVPMPALRKECKRREIPQKPSDKKADLVEKIIGQNTS